MLSNEALDAAGMNRCAIINRRFAFHLRRVLLKVTEPRESLGGSNRCKAAARGIVCVYSGLDVNRRGLTHCGM